MENNSHIDDILLIKYLTGETSESESNEVEKWLDSDSTNQQHFDELKCLGAYQ